MFKSAASKIAHNTTIPALAGNPNLRPLQDLITAEKAVLISLQRLSVDFNKAADALRIWGAGEGDDLGDILGASNTLLCNFGTSLSQYASLGHTMRDLLKTIRTREENLDDLKRRRRALGAKAESAEKKLSKMGSEHKHLQMQIETLNTLRAEIRSMDSEIMSEEAYLGDFKRTTTKLWMGLKFGGLMECCQKGTIAGEYGKLVIAEITEEQTQPGMARSLYYGRRKTESLLGEANQSMGQIFMSTVPPAPRASQDSTQGDPSSALPPLSAVSTGHFFDQPGTPTSSTPWQYSQAPYLPEIQTDGSEIRQTFDDFGVNISPPVHQSSTSGGQFATFPVKRPTGLAPPPLSLSNAGRSATDEYFPPHVAEALRSSQSPPDNPWNSTPNQPLFAPPPGPPPGMQPLTPGDTRSISGGGLHAEQPSELSYVEEHPQQQWAIQNIQNHGQPHSEPPISHARHGGESHQEAEYVPYAQQSSDVPPPPTQDPALLSGVGHYQQEPLQHPPNSTSVDSGTTGLSVEIPQPAGTSPEIGGSSPNLFQNQRRVPVPAVDPTEDERSRNAAAAREIGREMESLGPLTSPLALAQLRNTSVEEQRSRDSSPDRGRSLPSPHVAAPGGYEYNRGVPGDTDNNPLPAPHPWTETIQPSSRPASPARWVPAPMSRQTSGIGSQPPSPDVPPKMTTPSISTGADRRPGIGLGNPSWLTSKSTTSLDTGVSQDTQTGARTISAAAFRRQRMGTGPGEGGSISINSVTGGPASPGETTSPLTVKKRLPTMQGSAPRVGQRDESPLGRRLSRSRSGSREASPRGSPRARRGSLPPPPLSPISSSPLPPVPNAGAAAGAGAGTAEGEFDYLGAYVDAGSHQYPGGASGNGGRSTGYGEGRYATDLDKDSLR